MDGGAEGSRTPDLCSAIAALSQLSYGPGERHLGIALPACQATALLGRLALIAFCQLHGPARARRG